MRFHKRLAALVTLYAVWPGLVLGGTLAEIPLSLRGNVPSNVLFDMSVEYPTAITAAYNGRPYVKASQFEGLFDPNLCYDYATDHFVPVAAASAHACTAGRWSGNFLNWATMTGLDAFRYATTGGNRSTDTAALTILERTYISGDGGNNNTMSCAGPNTNAYFKLKCFNPTSAEFVDATPFSVNTTYAIDNLAKDIRMTLKGTETTTTTGPGPINTTISCDVPWTLGTSPYCARFKLGSTGSTGTCVSWVGNGGSSGNRYRCTAFSNFAPLNQTPVLVNSDCDVPIGSSTSLTRTCSEYDAQYTGDVTTTTTNTIDNTYNVRVEACNKNFPLRDNCQQYGNVYKPVGELQRNGEKMRFGVFAYYKSSDIDNAVMRSKLKYVGPRKYSGSLGFVNNPGKEWSTVDGTLVTNPDTTEAANSWGGAASNSGVINYLNKFGLQALGYKSKDNFGKMYYESLRYLRKLPPTAEYYEDAPANNDGFPVITDWYRDNDDPIQYSCQKNYVIAMGDQFTHCDKRLPGGSFAAYGPAQCAATAKQAADQGSLNNGDSVNVTTETNRIGELETPTIANLATTGTGAGTAASFYMSGLAHWAAINDIRPDLANNVPVFDSSTGETILKGQTVKTFIINVEENASLGVNSQFWYMAKYGGADRYTQTGTRIGEPLDWFKNVVNETSYKGDGTPNQTFTGQWPKTLLRAGNPSSMIASIKEALATIDGEIGSNSGLSQSSGDLRTGDGAYIYRAIFDSEHWAGNVQAYAINSDGQIASTPVWEAASLLPVPGNRVILSFNDGLLINGNDETGLNSRRGISFDPANFDTVLSERQREFLNRDEFGTLDSQGANRMRYLRGEAINEAPNGLQWRPRSWTKNNVTTTNRLGDIVNSNPVYVGAPPPDMPGLGYNAFARNKRNRKPVVYVGANDGMLHAFDASKPGTTGATPGEELLAFIPSAVYSRLSQLTSPGYSHKYYVDGAPVVSETCSGTCSGGADDWMTILVGGLNAGGQGVYALDVTDPAAFTGPPTDIVKWEFTDRDDADLGYTFSTPVVRLMNNGKWAVIFGNGFNNNVNDGKIGTGRAYLYVLMVDGPGAGNKWVRNTNYYKIELKSPSEPASATLPLGDPNANGLATVGAVDRDLNGTSDIVYAGDLQGNLWKIDVSNADPTQWKSAFGSVSSPLPLFTAEYRDIDNNLIKQPVTTGVDVSGHPDGGFMVMFGTGSFINSSDNLGPFNVDSMYGIWDKDDAALTRVTGRSFLQKQKVIGTDTVDGNQFLFLSACKPNFSSDVAPSSNEGDLCPSDLAGVDPKLGWVFDLPDTGERTASEAPFVDSGILTFTTLTPTTDPCTGNITGRLYYLDYLTGGASLSGVIDINGDGKIDAADRIELGIYGSLPPSGVVTEGGFSRRPIRFLKKLPPNPDIVGPGTSNDHPCADFVPGWGCLSHLSPNRNCSRPGRDVMSDNPLTDALSGGGSGFSATDICMFGNTGRLTWRQLTK